MSDIVFLDTGALRSFIDSSDYYNEEVTTEINAYLELHASFMTTTLNIAELSFWLIDTKSASFIKSGDFERFIKAISLKIYDFGSSKCTAVTKEWQSYMSSRSHYLDFTDFYFYAAALSLNADNIMTVDRADFEKLLALTPGYSFTHISPVKKCFTWDDIILFT